MGKAKYTRVNHGLPKTKAFRSWSAAKNRVFNPNGQDYHHYGGRGIKMCDEWKNSFPVFLKDMGEPPTSSYTLERVDNDGDYEPSNCQWATRREQANNRRNGRLIVYDGRTQTLSQWAVELGINYMLLFDRLALGWSMEEATSRPSRLNRVFTKVELQDIRKLRLGGASVNVIAKKYHIHKGRATGVLRQLGIYTPLRKVPRI